MRAAAVVSEFVPIGIGDEEGSPGARLARPGWRVSAQLRVCVGDASPVWLVGSRSHSTPDWTPGAVRGWWRIRVQTLDTGFLREGCVSSPCSERWSQTREGDRRVQGPTGTLLMLCLNTKWENVPTDVPCCMSSVSHLNVYLGDETSLLGRDLQDPHTHHGVSRRPRQPALSYFAPSRK